MPFLQNSILWNFWKSIKERFFPGASNEAAVSPQQVQLTVDKIYAQAEHYLKEESRELAIPLFLQCAEAGHVKSMKKLAELEYPDALNAFDWKRRAAENDDIDSIREVAWTYYDFRGLKTDFLSRAVNFFKRGAQLNDRQCIYQLAILHEQGEGVEKSLRKSFEYAKQAAELGHIDAMNAAGNFYLRGGIVEKNFEEAFKWHLKSANAGNADAYIYVGKAYENGTGVQQDWVQAVYWYQKSADADDLIGITNLALAHFRGVGNLKPNAEKALEIYLYAARKGSNYAMCEAGRLITYNPKLGRDLITPQEFFAHAADANNTEAMFITALYDFFMGTKSNVDVQSRTQLLKQLERAEPKLIELFFPNGLPALVTNEHLAQQLGKYYRVSDVATLLEKCKNEPQLITKDDSLKIERILEFYRLIEHPTTADWDACWVLAKAKVQHNQTYIDIKESVKDTGPRYNALYQEGWIQPGKPEEISYEKTGLVAVSNVAINNGEAVITGTVSNDPRITMVYPEDVDIALIFAFVENPRGPVRPAFSLESSMFKESFDPREDRFQRKEFFNVEWLAATDFGKTFYWTDYVMKEMGSNEYISLIDGLKRMPYDPEKHLSLLPEVLTTFERKGFHGISAADITGGRLMLTLGSVELSAIGPSVTIANPKMFIESSEISLSSNGVENRDVRPNDPSTSVGATAQYFTDKYDEIAITMPVFERLKQLLALCRACEKLRMDGYTLGNQQMRELRQKREYFVQQTQKKFGNKLQLVPRRVNQRGIICDGGVGLGAAEILPIQSHELRQAEENQKILTERARQVQQEIERRQQAEQIALREAQEQQKRADELRLQQERLYAEAQRQAHEAAERARSIREAQQGTERQNQATQAYQNAQHELEIQRQRERQAQQEAEQRQRQADDLRRQQNDAYIEAQRQADQAAALAARANADRRSAEYEASRVASEQAAAEQHRTAQAQLEVARRQEIERQTREMPSVIDSILRRQASFGSPSNDNNLFFNTITTTPAPSSNNEAAEHMEQRSKYLEAQGDAFEKSLESLQLYAERREEVKVIEDINARHSKHIGIENGEYVIKNQYVEVPSGPNPLNKIPDGTIAEPSLGAILGGVGLIRGASEVVTIVKAYLGGDNQKTNKPAGGGSSEDIPGQRLYDLAP